MLQIVDAVAYMHSKNVIHRDLKLGNVFLSRGGNVKIGDFGLATIVQGQDDRKTCVLPSLAARKHTDKATFCRTFCGTPNYIAPEVLAQNGGHSFEVDVWSLGVILYTLVIGKPPFETSKVEDTYEYDLFLSKCPFSRSLYLHGPLSDRRIRNAEYYFPEGVPSDLKDIIGWLLQRDPSASLPLLPRASLVAH